MTSITINKFMPYPAEIVQKIVLDIENYPQFLPWCSNVNILSYTAENMVAELEVNFRGLTHTYTSYIKFSEQDDLQIVEVEALSGPFKHLKNIWRIKKLSNGTNIDFFIDFEFKSKILESVLGMVSSSATTKLMNAFEQRAKDISIKHKII